MQLFVTFSEELDLKSFTRAREPAWNEWMNEKFASNKTQTSNQQVKVYFLSEIAESDDINDVKDLKISALLQESILSVLG